MVNSGLSVYFNCATAIEKCKNISKITSQCDYRNLNFRTGNRVRMLDGRGHFIGRSDG